MPGVSLPLNTYREGQIKEPMQSSYNGLELPKDGKPIEYSNAQFTIPDNPIIPFIEGDGTGRDIWKASQRVFDAAVEKAYGGRRAIKWFEIFAGEKAYRQFNTWLPDDSVNAARDLRVSIKGPLTTPVGGGIRSLNVALRQILDLYACVRPVKYYQGVPSPVKHPEKVDIVIFRENTEDVYSGIEFKEGSADAARLISFLNDDLLKGGKKKVRSDSGVGHQADLDLRHQAAGALRHPGRARDGPQDRDPGAQGQYPEIHRGRIPRVGLRSRHAGVSRADGDRARELDSRQRRSQFRNHRSKTTPHSSSPASSSAHRASAIALYAEIKSVLDSIGKSHGNGAWKNKILVNDRIADSIFQQIIIRPSDYSILATTNLNGDYISDAAAAQVGGLGIAPGANIGDGYAVFEATHGTAPKYADKDMINPGSVILSGVMMLEFIGWKEAAKMIETAMEKTIQQKFVTYDFERQTAGATKVGTSEFATRIIGNM